MATSAEQIRAFNGPAILSYGFRPFFLFGAAWAALTIAIWLPVLAGQITLPTALAPLEWHVHELVFGYVPAIVAGFLLTAVPNWTGRLPVVGTPLLMLVLAWAAGRAAVLTSAWIGPAAAGLVDLAFLAALVAIMGREIVAGGNKRNLRVLAAVGLLLAGNAAFHLEATAGIGSGHGIRLGVGATILLVILIGGRVIPSFTRNWLVGQRMQVPLPVPFDTLDAAVMVASAVTLAAWVAMPSSLATALLALVALALNAGRLARWSGGYTTAEPLVLVLHVAYAFVPTGFGLLALGILRPDVVAPSGALHGWTAGAIGSMTLAIMTRASLGHTGQPLRATRSISLIYVAAFVAAVARIVAAFGILRMPMLYLAAAAWVGAFGGFVAVYAPLLTRRRA